MRQIQVNVPEKFKDETEEVLKKYSSEVSSSKSEKDSEKFVEFTSTVDQKEIDDITEDLKGLEIKSGDLSIRVLEQETLIEKGVKTRGPSASTLSAQEIYSKSQKASSFNSAQWGMVALSGSIAGLGLVTGNLIVLLGAILLAPVLYPLTSIATGMRMGDKSMVLESSRTAFFSIFTISAFALPVFYIFGGSQLDVLMTGIELAALSFLVGGAAMLTLISEYREEMAGAALAVAIVPPAAAVAENFAAGNLLGFGHAVRVIFLNVLAVITSGYFILALSGAKPLTAYRLKDAKKLTASLVIMVVALILLLYQAI